MCSGSKGELFSEAVAMEGEPKRQEASCCNLSILLELSAFDDLTGFRYAVEEEGCDIDEVSYWYGRRIGSKKMGFELRTPLMIASMFGSKHVLAYILETGRVDVNRSCGSDKATALHCAVAGGAAFAPEIVKLLLDASADANLVDSNGNRPADLIASLLLSSLNSRKKALGIILKGSNWIGEELVDLSAQLEEQQKERSMTLPVSKDGTEKKEYPIDLSLPDIKNGIYGTDEFRMYTFKVKPCSRAYSHDWTECPFVHPGENARRRDPRKYHYSCVPCPEFRKGTCRQGDACEYAHGIFECWLHPAQYRTRLCKDETNCSRRVCFFAHKPEELRPLYASTGSAVPSPRPYSAGASSLDMANITPLALGSPSVLVPPASSPPLTPTAASSPNGGLLWQNQANFTTPTLQLPGSRLKSTLSARDMDLDVELLGLDSHHRRQQQLMEEMSSLSSPSSWNGTFSSAVAFATSGDRNGELNRLGGVKPTNLEDIFGSLDSSVLSQLQGLSLDAAAAQLQSPIAMQMRPNINPQLRSSYSTGLSSSSGRSSPSFGLDQSGAAAAVLNSRAAAFAKRSQSFIDRSALSRHSGFSSSTAVASMAPPAFSDWGAPNGKLDWGIQGEELNKLRKSASFGFRNTNSNFSSAAGVVSATAEEPDVSWVQTLVKDPPSGKPGKLNYEELQQQHHLNSGGSEMIPPWIEQLYMDQEQIMA
ncbi:Zinc finger, CCCH-type [Dillenia turbinata]|uniref:Zinc finger, CCCH-type n=1 Tax=Dillenia turbinata TaxID=194707 RepID=A0AAN8V421_9MAGN